MVTDFQYTFRWLACLCFNLFIFVVLSLSDLGWWICSIFCVVCLVVLCFLSSWDYLCLFVCFPSITHFISQAVAQKEAVERDQRAAKDQKSPLHKDTHARIRAHTHFRLSWTTQCGVPHTWAESAMDVRINQGGFNTTSSSNGCHSQVENMLL